jgi:hypothetical protein
VTTAGAPVPLSPDRVAQHRDLTLVRRGDSLELDRRAAGAFEQSDAVADEHRGALHDDLVEKVGLETLARDVGAQDDDVAAFGRLLGELYGLLDRDVEELAGDRRSSWGCNIS